MRSSNSPLNNVTLIGLTLSKTTKVAGDRVLMAYINNFSLLNWTFYHHGGAMFLRGSCQELAGGSSYDAALLVGSPGVRHIGNSPRAACIRPLPADVWVHHNNITCGDGRPSALSEGAVHNRDVTFPLQRAGLAPTPLSTSPLAAPSTHTCPR